MSLPLILPNGVVAVYGPGVKASSPQTATPQGIVISPDFFSGTVYNIWDGGAPYVYGGDVVWWKDGSEQCRVVTEDNLTYTLLKFSNLVTEPAVIPPP